MRMVCTAILAAFLCCAAPAGAAPTCQDQNGSAARCGAPGAMPLGWSLPPEDFHRRQVALQGTPDSDRLITLVGALVLFLAFLALLPEFDGRSDEDWLPDDKDRKH
jgi:hypothetical protein